MQRYKNQGIGPFYVMMFEFEIIMMNRINYLAIQQKF